MTDRALNESFETTGEWFLPKDPGRLIAGTLNYTPAISELHLHESFRPVHGAFRVGDTESYPLILGSTTSGELVTLVKAQRASFGINIGSAGMRQPDRIISSLLIVGAHLDSDFAYPEMSFRIPGLEVWVSRQVVEQQLPERDPGGKLTPTEYRVSGLAEETMRIDGIAATLGWGIHSHHRSTPTTVSVEASGWIRVRPDEPKPVEWFLTQLQKITTFLGIIAGSGMSADCINASIDESYHRVSIMVSLRDAKYSAHTTPLDFFMPRGRMGQDLALVVRQWFDVYPKIDSPSQLALSVFTSEKLWLHVEFLSLMQALEGFHRGLYSGSYITETEYETTRKILNDAIPPGLTSDHKDALRSKIKYGYQFSLRKRLNDLAGRLSGPVRTMILGTADGKVPGQWVDTRHYYTHWDEELRTNVLTGEGMYYANVRMRMFLRVLYLDLIGIPESAIRVSLGNASNISQHLVQLNILDRRRADPDDESGVIMTVTEQAEAGDSAQPRSTSPAPSADGNHLAVGVAANVGESQRPNRIPMWVFALAGLLTLIAVLAFR